MHFDPASRRAVALLIGIGEYQHSNRISSLRYAERDARALHKVLADPERGGFASENVRVLSGNQASRENIRRHLSGWLPKRAEGADLVLLYFAGHGVMESIGGTEEGFLLPHDADADDVVGTGLAMTDVTRWIDRLKARAVVVCLDCCHAGGLLPGNGMSLRGTRDLQIRRSLLERLSGRGRFLIASCDKDQKSIEADELKHGLFTYHLLQGLRGAGDGNGDGMVSILELFTYVSSAVRQDAQQRFGREQTPWSLSAYNEDVPLARVRASSSSKNTPQPPAAEPAVPPASDEAGQLERLRQLRRQPRLEAVPEIFGLLASRSEAVRQQARRALSALDWDRVVAHAETLARAGNAEAITALLDGLTALESHARVVALLDRLAGLLTGALRDRAVWLLDRKRLAQERERLAEVFRQTQSIYQIDKVLGPGTYTGAYLARQDVTGLEVVVRVLRAEFVNNPLVRSHFVDLGSRAVRLIHQNLVLTREARAIPSHGLYFIVRDFIPGATLREVLESGRRFEPAQACLILRQLLDALTPLHREGLVHAGIRPSNVFLTHEDRVILGDPCLPMPATTWDLPRLAYDFRYHAPELFGGTLRPSADLYALGCVAYELFHGKPPFVADNPYELIPRHQRDPIPACRPAALADWLNRLLAKQPAERFASLDQALRGLERVEASFRVSPKEKEKPGATFGSVRLSPISKIHTLWGLEQPMDLGPTRPPDSVHLLREQSLMELGDRQSLVHLTGDASMPEASMPAPAVPGDGGPITACSAPGNEGNASGRPASGLPQIPGFEILEQIGQGGMGQVYKARQVALDRIVVLKMIRSGFDPHRETLARFLREGRAIAKLRHPHIVSIYDLGDYEGVPYLVLEYCEGGSLARRLREKGLPTPRESAALLLSLALAMHHAHQAGIVHRDLKPHNILLASSDTSAEMGLTAKITDFGLALRDTEEESRMTAVGAVMGTPAYMAPEQAAGEGDRIGPRTDVYGLGAIFFECLTGRPPFAGHSILEVMSQVVSASVPSPRQLNADVPVELDAICRKCLAKAPKDRYASAEALADDLLAFLQTRPLAAPLLASASQPPETPRRRFWWWPF